MPEVDVDKDIKGESRAPVEEEAIKQVRSPACEVCASFSHS